MNAPARPGCAAEEGKYTPFPSSLRPHHHVFGRSHSHHFASLRASHHHAPPRAHFRGTPLAFPGVALRTQRPAARVSPQRTTPVHHPSSSPKSITARTASREPISSTHTLAQQRNHHFTAHNQPRARDRIDPFPSPPLDTRSMRKQQPSPLSRLSPNQPHPTACPRRNHHGRAREPRTEIACDITSSGQLHANTHARRRNQHHQFITIAPYSARSARNNRSSRPIQS